MAENVFKSGKRSVKALMKGRLPYNPEGREYQGHSDLVKSMDEIGMLLPICVSSGKVGDGHRRLFAADALGWNSVSVLDYTGTYTAEKLFCLLNDNSTRKVITGSQALLAYVSSGYRLEILPHCFRKRAERMMVELSKTTVSAMAESGFSFTYFDDIRKAVNRLSAGHEFSVDDAVRALILNKNKQALKHISENKELSQSVYNRKALKLLRE